jgi:hypothetical protein
MTSLSTAQKLAAVTGNASGSLVDDLVATYIAGIEHRRAG